MQKALFSMIKILMLPQFQVRFLSLLQKLKLKVMNLLPIKVFYKIKEFKDNQTKLHTYGD